MLERYFASRQIVYRIKRRRKPYALVSRAFSSANV